MAAASLPRELVDLIVFYVPPEDLVSAALALAPLRSSNTVLAVVAAHVPRRLIASSPLETLLAAARTIAPRHSRACSKCRETKHRRRCFAKGCWCRKDEEPRRARSAHPAWCSGLVWFETPRDAVRACLAWTIELRRQHREALDLEPDERLGEELVGYSIKPSVLDALFPGWSLQSSTGLALATFATAAALGCIATVRELLDSRIGKTALDFHIDARVGGAPVLESVRTKVGGSHRKSALNWACINGHLSVVQLLVSRGANKSLYYFLLVDIDNYDWEDQDDYTGCDSVLEAACAHGHEEIVRYLIGSDLLFSEISKALCSSSDHVEITRLLLESGVNPHFTVAVGQFPNAFENALSNRFLTVEVLQLFLDHGAANKNDDRVLKDSLHRACQAGYYCGRTDIIALLIDRGADLESRFDDLASEFDGMTPLLSACKGWGSVATIQLLLKRGANVKATAKDGKGALHFACQSDNAAELVPFLLSLGGEHDLETGLDLNAVDENMDTPLNLACAVGNLEVVQMLLAAEAKLAPPHPGQDSPLHVACHSGYREIVTLLLDAGADPNCGAGVHPTGTPLHFAALQGYGDLVRLLLSRGADGKATSAEAGTIYVDSVRSSKQSRWERESLLRSRGASDSKVPTSAAEAWIALDFVLGLGLVMSDRKFRYDYPARDKSIDEYEGYVRFKNSDATTLKAAEVWSRSAIARIFLDELGMPVPQRESLGGRHKKSALHLACLRRDVSTLKLLLEKGMDARVLNVGSEGVDASELFDFSERCRSMGKWDPRRTRECREILELLYLDHGVEETYFTGRPSGRPLLHLACGLGSARMVRELFKRSAYDVNLVEGGRESVTLLFLACLSPREDSSIPSGDDVVRMLLEMGADPNAPSSCNPLLMSVEINDIERIRLLLVHGADPNMGPALLQACGGHKHRNLYGDHPLTEPLDPDIRVVRLLLDHGANVNQGDPDGVTPLEMALSMHKQRFRRDSDSMAEQVKGNTPSRRQREVARLLLDRGAIPTDWDGFPEEALARDDPKLLEMIRPRQRAAT
jgi:ankyrin repeat protein